MAGAHSAVVACARPAAIKSQPIGLRGRCQARIPPQPANTAPIRLLVTTNASSASCHDQPMMIDNTAAVSTSAKATAAKTAPSQRARGPTCSLLVIGQVCAEHPPDVSGRLPDPAGELPASARTISSSAAPPGASTVGDIRPRRSEQDLEEVFTNDSSLSCRVDRARPAVAGGGGWTADH